MENVRNRVVKIQELWKWTVLQEVVNCQAKVCQLVIRMDGRSAISAVFSIFSSVLFQVKEIMIPTSYSPKNLRYIIIKLK